ncbi:MAG: apolipoprotein N-acyltransferase [Brevundimonas sp.]|nr:MAG: apolipoprotein N-acyltransferase [Brevundimonas sp.]
MSTLSATPEPRTRRPSLDGRWVRIVLALAAGAGAALAHPPFGVLPGLLGYPLLMILAERSTTRRGGFWVGWLAGFAYFFISCWWVAEAFLVDPEQAWMAPFAASLLPIGLAVFWGLATVQYRRFNPSGARRVLVFAAIFCLFEWLRGHILTGFPWNPAGASWKAGSAASQFASVAGVYGLSFVTVAAVSAFGLILSEGPRRARFLAAAGGVLALMALVGGGTLRLQDARLALTDTVVRVVQADVDQKSKWSPEAYQDILNRYLRLTAQPAAVTPDLIVWPEGALPASANQVFESADGVAIAEAVRPGQTLVLGLGRGQADPAVAEGARYFNSLIALTDDGGDGLTVTAIYDKYRLVPFGEFLPGSALLTPLGIRALTHMPLDFSSGPRPAPIRIPGLPPVQPLICYEALYPGFTPAGADRPRWIVNISNDAWFGRTSGPLQHLNLASYRAIETGLPVVRATPTGTSAFIDPWGRVIDNQRLDPGQSGVIDARLPEPTGPTPYGRWGDLPFAAAVVFGLLAAWRRRPKSR